MHLFAWPQYRWNLYVSFWTCGLEHSVQKRFLNDSSCIRSQNTPSMRTTPITFFPWYGSIILEQCVYFIGYIFQWSLSLFYWVLDMTDMSSSKPINGCVSPKDSCSHCSHMGRMQITWGEASFSKVNIVIEVNFTLLISIESEMKSKCMAQYQAKPSCSLWKMYNT